MEPTDLPAGVGATAIAIAAARDAESRRPDRLFVDPLAATALTLAGRAPIAPGGVLGDYVAVRTCYFDDYLLGASCRQVVLLAAGLDARAFRLEWPAGTRLFELDLPDSLAFKERVVAVSGLASRCERRVVAADLREDWGAALLAAGFEPAQPTAWLAEGLMSYLPEDARQQLLARLSALSAPGSTLALESAGSVLLRSPMVAIEDAARLAAFVRAYQGLWRAALPSDPAAWLGPHGWLVAAEPAAMVWERYGRPVPPGYRGGGVEAWWAIARRPA